MDKQLLRDFITTRHEKVSEGNTKNGKEQPVPATAKMYQMVKTNDAIKKLCQLMGKNNQPVTKWQIKITHNINLKCKWAKCINQKTQTGKLDKKPKPIGVLYPGNPSHRQGYTKAQNKGMEEDLPSKWRAKKKQELQFLSLIK